jgi:protein-tyrosine phosphatase
MRRMKKNVLVHCHAGISRSAAIVCAYLMTKNGWSFSEALNFIKKRRNRVKPNENFVYLLK